MYCKLGVGRGLLFNLIYRTNSASARLMETDWVRELRDNCVQHGVPFFFKQWGGVLKKRTGRTLDNRTWDQMPERR